MKSTKEHRRRNRKRIGQKPYFINRTSRGSLKSSLAYVAIVTGCIAFIFGPSLEGSRPGRWLEAPNFDGSRYVLGWRGIVRVAEDPSGLATLIATVQEAHVKPDVERAPTPRPVRVPVGDLRQAFSRLAYRHGLRGTWHHIEEADRRRVLERAASGMVAKMHAPVPGLVYVREVRNGYVYASDAAAGNVLYPLEEFLEAWTGHLYVLR